MHLHLGAHKTASTHLQHSLRLSADALRAGGLCLIEPSMLRENGPLPLAKALSEGEAGPVHQEARQIFAKMRAGSNAVLMTEENILGGTHRDKMFSRRGLIYPFAVRRVRQVIDIAGGGPVTLFLALRDPAAFNVSAFALQMTFGNAVDLPGFLGGRDPARVGWSGLVKRLADIDEVTDLIVWRYEDYVALRPRLLARMLTAPLAALVPDPPPSNESLTQAAYDWFHREAMEDTSADLRDLAHAARRRFRRAAGHAPLDLLTPEERARSAQHYTAEIARLRRVPKVTFLQP